MYESVSEARKRDPNTNLKVFSAVGFSKLAPEAKAAKSRATVKPHFGVECRNFKLSQLKPIHYSIWWELQSQWMTFTMSE